VTVAELLALLIWKGVSLQSRGPEILAIVVALLATLQYYGIAWAILPAGGDDEAEPVAPDRQAIWTRDALRVTIPALIAAGIGVHFLFRSAGMAHGAGSGAGLAENPLGMVPLLGFLLVWQVAAMGFYAAAEVEFGGRAARHLQAVTQLNFDHRSQRFGWGYWPELFQAMNQLSQGLLERSRLIKGFSSFVSNRVVEDVLQQTLHFGGKRGELTVLMADLRGFTTLAESLKPEEVVRLLNLYFHAMIEELGREGVTVDKFIGDGLLAYVDPEDSAPDPGRECTRAVRAALNMVARLGEVNEQLAQVGLPRLRIGIGLTRGSLVLGNIGSQDRMQFTIIGDTVNLAARLESLCKELGAPIVLDHSVWALLPPALQEEFRGEGLQLVKGRAEKVRVYTWSGR
jgi:adenylate cyclase